MVNKAVAVAGLVLLTVGVAMTAVIMVIEEWVVVTLPGTPACDDAPVGNLGLYTATYDPACTAEDSPLRRFPKTESGTTEFWPLFPVQTKYGGFFDSLSDSLPVATPEFKDDCDAYFGEVGEVTAPFQAFRAGTTGFITVAKGGAAALLTANDVNLTLGVQQAFGLLDQTVETLWAGALTGGLNKTYASFEGFAALSTGIFDAFAGASILTVADATTIKAATIPAGDVSGVTWATAVTQGIVSSAPTDVVDMWDKLDATVTAGLVAGAVGLTPEDAGAALGAIKLIVASAGAQAVCSGVTFADCVDTNMGSSSEVAANVLGETITTGTLALVGPLVPVDPAPAGLVNTCLTASSNNPITGAACLAVFTEVPEDLNAPWGFCVLAEGAGLIAGLPADNAQCSAAAVIRIGGSDPILLEQVPEESRALVPNLVNAYDFCASVPLTKSECVTKLSTGAIPDTYTDYYGPCLLLGCTSFLGFPDAVLASDASEEQKSAIGLLGTLVGLCASGGALSDAACNAAIATNQVFHGLLNLLPGLEVPVEGAAFADDDKVLPALIQQCKDDEEDARRIELAQVLVPISISAEGVALLLGVAVVILAKGPLAIAAGVLSLAGFALTLSALLLVRGAPVYANVGGDEVIGDPYYSAGQAETFGLIAIATPLLAGISFIVAGLLNRGESEGALTSKVENTY